MDVIALHQAGFTGAVAPLGTALTAEQLEGLWRVAPAPVLCFDGDTAGRRAAIRAAETALPLLDPERTLRFIRLPEGEDPDSLVRRGGPAAMTAQVAQAARLSDVLFELLSEGIRDPGPEQRASLHAKLTEAAATIGHKGLAAEYRRTLQQRFFEMFARRPGAKTGARPGATPGARSQAAGGSGGLSRVAGPVSARPVPVEGNVQTERMRLLLAILLRHPDLLHDVEQALCGLDLPDDLRRVRESLLEAGHLSPTLDSAGLIAHLHSAGLSAQADMIIGSSPLPMSAHASPEAMPADAERAWWHFFGLLNVGRLSDEVEAAARTFAERGDEPSHRRLNTLVHTLSALRRGEQADEDEWNG